MSMLADCDLIVFDKYKTMIVERFSNPAIGDQVLRIAGGGAAKLPIFHAKTIATLVAADADIRREAFLLACFARYLLGRDDAGHSFPVIEPSLSQADWDLVRSGAAGVLRASPFAALGLAGHSRFRAACDGFIGALERRGAAQTIQAALS